MTRDDDDHARSRRNHGGRPRTATAHSSVSSWIPTTDHDALVRIAHQRGVTVSRVVRAAITRLTRPPDER